MIKRFLEYYYLFLLIKEVIALGVYNIKQGREVIEMTIKVRKKIKSFKIDSEYN